MKVRSALVASVFAVFTAVVLAAQAPAPDTTKPAKPTPPETTEPAQPDLKKPVRPNPPEPVQPKPHPIPPRPRPKPPQPLAPKPGATRRQAQSDPCLSPRPRLRETPEVTWYPLSHLQYPQPLTTDQLNATADVPGTYDYNPSFGYVPPRGICVVTLTFMPDDACRYNIVITNRSIIVQ